MQPPLMLVSATPVEQAAEGIREVRAALLAQRRLRGRRFCDEYTAVVDGWLAELFAAALRTTGRRDATGFALVAVGGYGRRELCPASDLDLLLVHDGVKGIAKIADALWYPIWDAGLNIDHSVRTIRESVGVVDSDLRSALALLSARPIAGDERLAHDVAAQTEARWVARPRVTLERLRSAIDERWYQHGELAFLLEPDVKLSRGGLRDLDCVQAAAVAAPVVAPFLEDPKLEEAGNELLALRVALHATTGRRRDRLLLEDQDAVARRLGYADADELMPGVAAAARRVAWATDQVWRRIDTWLAGPRATSPDRPVAAGIAIHGEELALDGRVDPGADSALALRLAATSARTGLPIGADALALLETDAAAPPEPWPAATRDAFVDLLGCGHAAVPLFETLDHLGVLGRYVREWQAVRSKPQRNAYHRYTVDRHSFEAAAEATLIARDVHRPDLLLVAALFHDIGKGFPGDHSAAGEGLMRTIAERMGFDEPDVGTLERLVGNHLLIADTAMRRDLSDPATIEMVADRVETIETLELLDALTRADSIATGPAAWSGWKETLIEELVVRTRAHLLGVRQQPVTPEPTQEQRGLMKDRALRLVPDGTRLTVVAPDRTGLLAIVAGTLAVNGLAVRAATGLSEGGMAVEVFDLDLKGREPDWGRLAEDLERAFDDPEALRTRLADLGKTDRLPVRPGAATVPEPRVLFDNDATPRATIVEVRAPDGVGVLSRIARSLAACDCDIGVVRALTLGHEVVDIFYVTDGPTGKKMTDDERLSVLERRILGELESDEG
jgi:[protein-PII] uridylyltransferase